MLLLYYSKMCFIQKFDFPFQFRILLVISNVGGRRFVEQRIAIS